MDPACLLEQIELQITRAKEEALSRKEILEKFEKWLGACQEECWLEEYNRVEHSILFGTICFSIYHIEIALSILFIKKNISRLIKEILFNFTIYFP